MSNENFVGLALRFLPALIVFILAFVAASDPKSRVRWANLMYQVGNVRADQRDDAKVQGGVRWPFFLVALVLLAWPLFFYRHATRTLEVKSNLYSQPRAAPSIYDQDHAANSVNNSVAAPTQVAPAAPRVNIYGTPMPSN